jgi:sugar/nucleoside kinase (ribokinase family)
MSNHTLIDVSKMSKANVFDLVTVGHFAIDTIISSKTMDSRTTLGGPPTYVSVAAAKLGAKVSVISKVGNDFPKECLTWLRSNNVDLSGLKKAPRASTTRFVLEYKNWQRQLRLEARAPPILPSEVSRSMHSTIVHVAPITNEVSHGVVTKLRKSAGVLSLDPQGFVRSFDKKGSVNAKKWRDAEVLAQIDVFKSAVREIQAVMEIQDLKPAMRKIEDYGARIIIVTRGMRGSTLLFEKQFYNVPACRSKIVVDPTGAGDAYIGGFLAEYVRDKDVLWCACVGSAAASFVVEAVGPESFGEKHEVYERAQSIYEKVAGKKSSRVW